MTCVQKSNMADIDQLIDCHRSILWALYEYSLQRSEQMSKHLHTLLHQNQFECSKPTTNYLLRTLLHEHLWKSSYDEQLPMVITGISRLRDFYNRLDYIKKDVIVQTTEDINVHWYRHINLPEKEMLRIVHLFSFWLIKNNNVNFLSKDLAIKICCQIAQIRIICQILKYVRQNSSNTKVPIKNLQLFVQNYLYIPKSLRKIYTLVKKNLYLKTKYEAIVKNQTRLMFYVNKNGFNDLERLCDSSKINLVKLIAYLTEFMTSCRSQVEIIMNNISFIDSKYLNAENSQEPISNFIQQIRKANKDGHVERLRILAENSCLIIDRLVSERNGVRETMEHDLKVILNSSDESEEAEVAAKSDQQPEPVDEDNVVCDQESNLFDNSTQSDQAEVNPRKRKSASQDDVLTDANDAQEDQNDDASNDESSQNMSKLTIPLKFHVLQVYRGRAYKVYK